MPGERQVVLLKRGSYWLDEEGGTEVEDKQVLEGCVCEVVEDGGVLVVACL